MKKKVFLPVLICILLLGGLLLAVTFAKKPGSASGSPDITSRQESAGDPAASPTKPAAPSGVTSAPDSPAKPAPADDPSEVAAVILHTNDVHVAFESNIGYDGLALYKKEMEALYDHVLLVDAGDAIQGASIGAISKGAEVIRMMNRLGYDLAVPGNHEFDFGFEALDECANTLRCGYTCANFCTPDGAPVFRPWRILEAGELKIGFVGTVTPDTFTKSVIKDILNEVGEPMYDFLADETGDRLVKKLQMYIDEARNAGADYVILVSHLGSSQPAGNPFCCDTIVSRLSGLDMVIDGHSHELFNRVAADKDGRQIPFAQTGTQLKAIGQLMIYKDGRMEEQLIDSVPEPKELPFERVTRGKTERCVDPEMKEFLDGILASYAPVMERKIGELSCDLNVRDEEQGEISRRTENGLCSFVADAFRAAGGSEAALINAGTVRNNLEAGTVTYKDVLNILPYSNEVVTARVTGQMLLDALEFGVMLLPRGGGRFPQVSGISFHVNTALPGSVRVNAENQFLSVDGERRVSQVTVNGEPLDVNRKYTLTINNFIFTGGDGYTMFKDAEALNMMTLCDNEIVMKYIEENLGGVIPDAYKEPQGRIIIEEK